MSRQCFLQLCFLSLLLLLNVNAVKLEMLHKKRSSPTSFVSAGEHTSDPNPSAEITAPTPAGMESVQHTTSLAEFHATGVLNGDNPLSQVQEFINRTQTQDSAANAGKSEKTDNLSPSFLEVGSRATVVKSYCEVCILVVQMKERGEPHLCAGLNDNYFITCVEILESLLRADKAIVYWLKNGCMHLDETGPEIVRPCPALSICSWVPNLFARPPLLVKDTNEALCPKDLKFLPTIPEEYKSLLGAGGDGTTSPPASTNLLNGN
jgi:hypothetical protein